MIRLKVEIKILTEKFEEGFYFPSALAIVAKRFENEYFRSFISKYVFPLIGSYIHNIQINSFRVKLSVTYFLSNPIEEMKPVLRNL